MRSATGGPLTLVLDAGSDNDSVAVRELATGNFFDISLGAGNDNIQIAGEKLLAGASILLDGGPGGAGDFDSLGFSTGGNPVTPPVPLIPNGMLGVIGFGVVTYTSIDAPPEFNAATASVGTVPVIPEGQALGDVGHRH